MEKKAPQIPKNIGVRIMADKVKNTDVIMMLTKHIGIQSLIRYFRI